MFLSLELMIVAIPVILILLFIVGIVGCIVTKVSIRKHPEKNLNYVLWAFITILIVDVIFIALLVLVVVGFYILLNRAIAYM